MFVTLTKITADRRRDFHSDTEEPGEEHHDVVSVPVRINAAAVRCFYPRKDNAPGTRITFTDGGGFAVTETFEQVSEVLYT
jgi:hypothetical protein